MSHSSPLRQLGIPAFLAELDTLSAVYAAAMKPDAGQLPGRRVIMERHAGHPGFRALAVSAETGQLRPVIAFGYGFRGMRGQWWHDVVWSALTASAGQAVAAAWLGNTMEIAELHVHPDYQRRGIGRCLLTALASRRQERTAVLSTPDVPSPARRLYRSVGFADLLTDFSFPGGGPRYAVMGAVLPLCDRAPAPG